MERQTEMLYYFRSNGYQATESNDRLSGAGRWSDGAGDRPSASRLGHRVAREGQAQDRQPRRATAQGNATGSTPRHRLGPHRSNDRRTRSVASRLRRTRPRSDHGTGLGTPALGGARIRDTSGGTTPGRGRDFSSPGRHDETLAAAAPGGSHRPRARGRVAASPEGGAGVEVQWRGGRVRRDRNVVRRVIQGRGLRDAQGGTCPVSVVSELPSRLYRTEA